MMRVQRQALPSRREFFRATGRYTLGTAIALATWVLVRRGGGRCFRVQACSACWLLEVCSLDAAEKERTKQSGGIPRTPNAGARKCGPQNSRSVWSAPHSGALSSDQTRAGALRKEHIT